MPASKDAWPYACRAHHMPRKKPPCPEYRCCSVAVRVGEVPLCERSDAEVGIPLVRVRANHYEFGTGEPLRDIEVAGVDTHSSTMPRGVMHMAIKEF